MAALGLIMLTFVHNLRSYEFFRLPWSEDQAQFNQVMWNLVNQGNLANSIYTSPCFFSGKFDPIMFFLAPLYFFQQRLSTLLLIAIICLWSTGIILYLIAYQITKNSLIAFLAALLFYFYGPVLNLSTMGFRETIVAMPFFALGLYFYLRQSFWPMMVALMLAAFCREDVPLILIGFSLLAVVERRGLAWKLAPGAFGFIYFYLIYMYIMPWCGQLPLPQAEPIFRPDVAQAAVGGANFGTYHHLGATPLEILKNLFWRFDIVIGLFTRPEIPRFFSDLLSPLYYLPVLSFYAWAPFSQYLIICLSDRSYFASVGVYYFAPTVPFLFAGLVSTLYRLKRWLDNHNSFGLFPNLGTALIIIVLAIMLWQSRDNPNRIFKDLGSNPDYPGVEKILRQIPPEAAVTAQLPLLQNLSSRQHLYIFASYPQAEYLILAWGGNSWPLSSEDYERLVKRILVSGDYGLIGRQGGILLFQRGASTQNNGQLSIELFKGTNLPYFDRLTSQYKKIEREIKALEINENNLIANNGFESIISNQPVGWRVDAWQKVPGQCFYLVTSEAKKAGDYSIEITHKDLADSRWGQVVKVKPNTYYKLSGWIKSRLISPAGEGAFLQIVEPNNKTEAVMSDSEWKQVYVVFKTRPDQKTVMVWLRLGNYGRPNTGTAFFDNVALKETRSFDELY